MSVLNSTNKNTAHKRQHKKENINLKFNKLIVPFITTTLNLKSNTFKPEAKRFNQWLAGLM
jgi:hypothetical protein